jgi:predicted dienelactone hydrolase
MTLSKPTAKFRSFSARAGLSAFVVVAIMSTAFLQTNAAGASGDPSPHQTSNPPFGVGVARCTFVDQTRTVLNYSTTPPTTLSNHRTLVTEIRYPTQYVPTSSSSVNGAKPMPQSGGYPMIVFAAGYDVTPDTYAPLLDAWVREGFVVAAPFFPDENRFAVAAQHGANTENDLPNEPADLTFVTHAILDASANESTSCHIMSGLVDASELGLAGHSDGATAVGLLAFAHGNDPNRSSYASLRAGLDFRAVTIMSGDEDAALSYSSDPGDAAMLVIQSAADQCNPIRNAVKFYDDIHQSNKWFLELRTAHHLPPFDGVDAPAFQVVAEASTRFFRIALQSANPVIGLTAYGNQNPSVATMFSSELLPALKTPSVTESCGPN